MVVTTLGNTSSLQKQNTIYISPLVQGWADGRIRASKEQSREGGTEVSTTHIHWMDIAICTAGSSYNYVVSAYLRMIRLFREESSQEAELGTDAILKPHMPLAF